MEETQRIGCASKAGRVGGNDLEGRSKEGRAFYYESWSNWRAASLRSISHSKTLPVCKPVSQDVAMSGPRPGNSCRFRFTRGMDISKKEGGGNRRRKVQLPPGSTRRINEPGEEDGSLSRRAGG